MHALALQRLATACRTGSHSLEAATCIREGQAGLLLQQLSVLSSRPETSSACSQPELQQPVSCSEQSAQQPCLPSSLPGMGWPLCLSNKATGFCSCSQCSSSSVSASGLHSRRLQMHSRQCTGLARHMATEAGTSSSSDSGFDSDIDSDTAPDKSAVSNPEASPEGLLAPTEDVPPSVSQPAFVAAFQSANEKKRAQMLQQVSLDKLAPYEDIYNGMYPGMMDHQEKLQEWMSDFMSQVINIRGVSKGMRTGGIRRFSAVVVAGNRQGVLGMGTGKAAELAAAVNKANMRALKNLFTVPRYDDATTWQARTAKYGKAKVITYPRSSGSGILASPMLSAICDLAGIRDIGIKVHGTRNAINIVKAFIIALESQSTPEELALHRQQQQLQQQQRQQQQPAGPAAHAHGRGHARLRDALLQSQAQP